MSGYRVKQKDDSTGLFIGNETLYFANDDTEVGTNLYQRMRDAGYDPEVYFFTELANKASQLSGLHISKMASVVALNNAYGENTYNIKYASASPKFPGILFDRNSPYNFNNNISYWFDDHRNIKITFASSTPYNPTIQFRNDDTVVQTMSGYTGNGQFMTIPWYNKALDKMAYWQITSWTAIVPDSSPTEYYMKGLRAYTGAIPIVTNVPNALRSWFEDFPDPVDEDNPYDSLVDGNNHGGENTNFDGNSDAVVLDNLPTLDSVGTGFATIFTPTKTQLRNLADVFWSQNIFAALQNLVENISSMFTSLAMVPFTVEAGATVGVTWLGLFDTALSLTLASKQFYEFDMGSINLTNDSRIFTYDNCLDYSPFSKLGIYLPFIGFQDLDIDECRGETLHLIYRIDILSGACVAIIYVSGSVLYQFSGNCLTQIPITNENMQSLVTDAVNVGIAAASARTAGAASAAEMRAIDSNEAMSSAQKEAHRMHAQVTSHNADAHLSSAAADACMGLKPQYNKSGSVSSAVSMLSVKQPYLFLTTSRLSMPAYYEHYAGFPSNITDKLNTFSGFTVVNDIRLNGLVATSQEVEEIYKLLKTGVII